VRQGRARGLLPAAGIAAIVLRCAPAYDPQTLYSQLQSPDSEVRQDAEEKIDKIVRTGDYQVFVRGAMSPVKTLRAPSLLYLARMTQPDARAALRAFLRVDRRSLIPFNPIRMKPSSEESDSRILVANLIALNGGDPGAVDTLVEGMDGQPSDVLAGTCYALGALRDPKGIPFLRTATGHRDTEVVRAAAQALGMFHGPEVMAGLASLLTHPSEVVRSEVLSALQLQQDPGVADVLEKIATADPSPELRASAISQLSRFKKPSPVPFLIDQLKVQDGTTRQAALDALRQLSGQSYGPHPEQWNRWWQESQKSLAARP
jgi:HEAT repeat protein